MAFYVKLKHAEVSRKLGRMIYMEDKFFFFPCDIVQRLDHLGKVQITYYDPDGNKSGIVIKSDMIFEL